ncbi:MAG: flagellar basal body-associated FliL family protein [Syntrophorhabdaceae bacterium]|nr:flagellar basal body-associated FliL family protein [Syntrophorhabdaceae bacterium]
MATEQTEDAKKAPKKKSKLLFVILIIVFALSIGAGGTYFFFAKKMLGGKESAPSEEAKPVEKKVKPGGPILSLDPFLFNIFGSGNKFAKVTIGIQVKDDKVMEDMKKMIPLVRDRVLSVLGTKSVDILIDVNNRNLIKDEIMGALRGALKDKEQIQAVYITDIIIQ